MMKGWCNDLGARLLNRQTLLRLVRSGGAGVLATAAQFGSQWLLVAFGGMGPVRADVPALVFGSVVMFLGQKYFVFDARAAKTLWLETVLYAIVQVVGIGLTLWLLKVCLELSPRLEPHYVLVGLVVNNLVWLFYFFPLWHFVFKSPAKVAVVAAEAVRVSVAPEADGE